MYKGSNAQRKITNKNSSIQSNLSSFLTFDPKNLSFKPNAKKLKPNPMFEANVLKLATLPNTMVVLNGKLFSCALQQGITAKIMKRNSDVWKECCDKKDCGLDENSLSLPSQFLWISFEENKLFEPLTLVMAGTKNLISHLQVLVGQGSKAKLVQQIWTPSGVSFQVTNGLTVQNNSHFSMVQTPIRKNHCPSLVKTNATVGAFANFEFTSAICTSSDHMQLVQIMLAKTGAKTEVNGAVVANKKARVGNFIRAIHQAPNTQSNIVQVGIGNDQALVVVDGLNKIEKGNAKSSAKQSTQIINLTNTAHAHANPQLYIDEYDVEAGHSATVGKLDDEQIYYLMSRGLTKQQATQLLVMSVLDKVICKMGEEQLTKQFVKDIQKKTV